MTPERKKYLAGISKEERAIRQALAEEKGFIRMYKDVLSCGAGSQKTYKLLVAAKAKIKALKKQLPAPRKEIDIGLYWAILNCPICRTTNPIHAGYCLCCGQKLR